MPELNGRPYARTRTGIDDLQKLREVKQSLVRREATDRLRQRAKIRREYNSVPLTQKPEQTLPPASNVPYIATRYNPDSDRWLIFSLSNPSEQFLAYPIKSGGIATGSTVRGYPTIAFEPQPQGRRFSPVEETKSTAPKEITIDINIGYTGKK